MPRTKVSKQAAATKRIRVSAMEESRLAALHSLDTYAQAFVDQENLKLETNLDLINDLFRGVMGRIPERIKNMTLGDYERFGAEPTDFSNVSSASALANSTTTAAELSKKNKTSCRSDDGYVTEENATSVIINGPLSSAKSRPRRSRSAQSSTTNRTTNFSNKSTKQGIGSHSSRNLYRTPAQNRLQTQSVDRMGPITPKCQANTPVALLRYPKQGETVISLSGSPVIVQGIIHDNANINIPIANGIFSMQPSAFTSADTDLMSRIDSATLLQLKQLQTNLNMIMSQASVKLTN